MSNENQRKKPIKLEWQGGILESNHEASALQKKKASQPNLSTQVPKKIGGKLVIRMEKKGRAGNPVSILYQFSDPEAKNQASLKQLCSELKNKFACGGTVENGEIILMIRDQEKLKKVLVTDFLFDLGKNFPPSKS